MKLSLSYHNFKTKSRFSAYLQLIRWDRPIGTLLLLWPTMSALWLASGGHPQLFLVAVFSLGAFVMRSAGCVINDWADRHFDGHVARTQKRPLATGQVTPNQALGLFMILVTLAFGLVCLTNTLTIVLSLGAVLLVCLYPFAKRYTYLPQVVLGATYSCAIPMAYTAQKEAISLDCGLLYGATLIWAVAYDTLYAMVDREDDKKIGIKSTALLFGKWDLWAVALLQTCMIGTYILIGHYLSLGPFYYLGIASAIILLIRQQIRIRTRCPKQCFQAFLNNHWVGLSLFMGVFLEYSLST